ncbi:hypothetical protein Tco_1502231 [Tanacetum coccineum]
MTIVLLFNTQIVGSAACKFGGVKDTKKKKSLATTTPLSTAFISTSIVQDFYDSPDDEEDTRSNQEYLNDLEEEFHERALLAKFKKFFKGGIKGSVDERQLMKPNTTHVGEKKPELRLTKDFEAKYNKVKAKPTLLNSSDSASKSSMVKNKGLVAEAYEWDEEDVSSNNNEMVEVKVLMALVDDENVVIGKESARKCISEQIPTQKKTTMGVDKLTEDPSSSGQKDLVFVKSSADDTKVSILKY